jgi:hypothetical protein
MVLDRDWPRLYVSPLSAKLFGASEIYYNANETSLSALASVNCQSVRSSGCNFQLTHRFTCKAGRRHFVGWLALQVAKGLMYD